MKKTALSLFILSLMPAVSQAGTQTASLGWAHSEMSSLDSLNGVNLKYRYETASPLSVIGSFTWLKGDQKFVSYAGRDRIENKADVKSYSLMAGPAWRLNEYISFYGLLGVNNVKADVRSRWFNWQSTFADKGYLTENHKKTAIAYGVGIQLNSLENIAVDIGYEGSTFEMAGKDYHLNGFNLAVGYRF
jgi:putative virulence related protein PagC